MIIHGCYQTTFHQHIYFKLRSFGPPSGRSTEDRLHVSNAAIDVFATLPILLGTPIEISALNGFIYAHKGCWGVFSSHHPISEHHVLKFTRPARPTTVSVITLIFSPVVSVYSQATADFLLLSIKNHTRNILFFQLLQSYYSFSFVYYSLVLWFLLEYDFWSYLLPFSAPKPAERATSGYHF